MKLDSSYNQKTLVRDTNNLNASIPEIWFPNKSFGFKEKPSQKIFCLKMQLYGQMNKRVY